MNEVTEVAQQQAQNMSGDWQYGFTGYKEQLSSPCPSCGYCPHCGRGRRDYWPTYPWNTPTYPWWQTTNISDQIQYNQPNQVLC